jgi:hypothetical protein
MEVKEEFYVMLKKVIDGVPENTIQYNTMHV